MRHLLLCFILCFLLHGTNTIAQEATYIYSNPIPLRPQDNYQGLLDTDSTGYTLQLYENGGKGLLDLPGRTLMLEKYNKDFKQVFSYAYGNEGEVSVDIVALKETFIWIVMEKKGQYKYECSMIPISKDGKQGKKQFLFVAKIDKVDQIPICQLQLSPDATQVAFIATFDWDSKRESTDIFTAVINSKAEILWKKFTSLKGNQKQYDIKDYKLNDQQEILCIAKIFKDKKAKEVVKNKRDKKVAGYNLNLMKIDAHNNKPQIQKLELNKVFINQAAIRILPSGEIICAGLTSPKHDGHINGFFYSKYDREWRLLNSDTRELSATDLIRLSKGDADVNLRKKDNAGLDETYDLCNIIPYNDGSCVISLEQNYVIQNTNFNDPFNNSFYGISNRYNNNTTAHYRSNDLITVYITNNGNISDINLIPKKQQELIYSGFRFINVNEESSRKESTYLSHTYMMHHNEIYFIYNDHNKNITEAETQKKQRIVYNVKDMESTIVSNQRSNIKSNTGKTYFFAEQDADLLISPNRTKQISSNQLFFSAIAETGGNNRLLRFGLMTFH